jgi:hypothetical protein
MQDVLSTNLNTYLPGYVVRFDHIRLMKNKDVLWFERSQVGEHVYVQSVISSPKQFLHSDNLNTSISHHHRSSTYLYYSLIRN